MSWIFITNVLASFNLRLLARFWFEKMFNWISYIVAIIRNKAHHIQQRIIGKSRSSVQQSITEHNKVNSKDRLVQSHKKKDKRI